MPNDNGTLALYTVSSYSFEAHSQTNEIKILDIKTQQSILFSDDPKIQQVVWLHGIQLLWLRNVDGGKTEFWTGFAVGDKDACLAGTVAAPIGGLKIAALANAFAVAVTGLASPDGSLYNPENATKPLSSAREYTTSSVRWWDHYWTKERNSLWYTTLEENGCGSYKLASSCLQNVLKGTRMECPFPDPLNSPDGQFDISKSGIAFICRDPDTLKSQVFKFSLYYLPVSNFRQSAPTIRKIEIAGFTGSAGSPTFSPSGDLIAITLDKDVEHPSNTSVYVIDTKAKKSEQVIGHEDKENWDYSPNSLLWSCDSKSLYMTADDRGRGALFRVELSSATSNKTNPVTLSSRHASISTVHRLTRSSKDQRLLITSSNYIDSSIYTIMNASNGETKVITSATSNGSKFGLHTHQVSEIEFNGAGDYKVQAFVVKPSKFDASKKYPLAFMIHGGPQSDWKLAWSTRWNPAIFAEQGYVVVLPNPTGSTGFGEAFCNGVLADWGGRPYNDLVKCFDHIETSMPYVDTSRAVALGASYGGYMVNWIAGQPFAKKFKAMVCHDGIFANYNMMASDLVGGPDRDHGAHLWVDKTTWDRFDPAQHTDEWTTPMLIVHSDKDYRCPVTEGWAAYAVCQGKGIESRYLNFPDETHFVLKPENSLRWHKTVLGWINRFTGVEGGVELEPPLTEPWEGGEDARVELERMVL